MAASEPTEDVRITLDSETFRAWEKVEIVQSIDAISSLELSAPFEAERAEFRRIFRPFKFQSTVAHIGEDQFNNRLFTGRVVGIHPKAEADRREVAVTAYALPGVLVDCNPPPTKLPLEFRKLKFRQIAGSLADPFDIRVDCNVDDGGTFDKVKISPEKKIFEFLTDLAQQRNLVLTSSPFGALLCWRSIDTGHPVARLRLGEQPVEGVEANFSPQDYFSEITGFAGARRGRNGGKWTEQNKWLTDVLRPHCFKPDKIEKGDLPQTVRAKLGRMFANMVSWDVPVATWRDPNGALWRPNTTVTLLAPDAMVYRETELLIREVKLRQEKDKTSAVLNLVFPGVFTAEIPDSLPWDD